MDGRYGTYIQGSSGWSSMRNEEFQEEDIWGTFRERAGSDSRIGISGNESSPSFTSRRHPAAARMIPRAKNHPARETNLVQHSAPVNIPDWSKIYGTNSNKSRKSSLWLDEDDDGSDGPMRGNWESDEEDDDDEDDVGVIPPHEWLAKKLARSQISSFSVCEGAGRTLKGRDLRRLRNAVLTETGFLE